MDYSGGMTYGYDQVSPNMFGGSSYDPVYNQNTPTPGQPVGPHETAYRTFVPPPAPRVPGPILTYAETANRPRHSLDSALIGRGCSTPPQNGLPGDGLLASGGRRRRDPFSGGGCSSSINMSDLLVLMFAVSMILTIMINNVNLRHLTKQVKLLTRRNIELSGAIAPALRAASTT